MRNILYRLKKKGSSVKFNLALQKGMEYSSLSKVPSNISKNYHEEIIKCIQQVQATNPLVLCITNRVTPQKMANCLLAFGASPAMIDNPAEVKEFAQLASSVYFNLGLHTSQIKNIKILENLRKQLNKDQFFLVVDPIAVGATNYRASIIKDILIKCQPNIIKGNISEIYYLDKELFLGKGVDSNSSSSDNSLMKENSTIVNFAKNVAIKYNSIVLVTAKNDIIVTPFSKEVAVINVDLPILTKITGTGCTVGALCAATVAAYSQNKFIAAVSAILLYKMAALAAYQTEKLPGSLHYKIIDEIYNFAKNPQLINFENLDIYNKS